MFLGWNNQLHVRKWLFIPLLVISCLSVGLVKTLNQKRMENSDDTVLASLETSMVANWSSSFRPHGAYVDEVRFTIFEKGEWAQALLALDGENIDAFDGQIPLNFLPPMPPDCEISWFPSTTYKQLILNSGRFPTNITAFRRAIAFSFDKGQANVFCTGGTGKIQDSYIPRTVTEWEVESQLPEHFYEQDVVSGNNSLINAGFIDLDGDGWREYDKNHNSIWDPGVDLDDEDPSIVIDLGATAGNDPDFYVCRTAQDGLTQMGIHSNIVIKDYDTLLADAANGTFWAFCFNTVVDPTNPPAFLYSYFRSNSAANLFWFSNSTIDATLAEMVTAPSLDEVKEIAAEATILLTFEQPAIVCYNEAHINAYRTDIFTGFFEFKGNGYTGRNPYCATKVHLKDSLCPLGGTFKMSMLGDLETTNIHSVSEVSTDMVMGYIYEKLWQIDPLTWDPIPGLAYDWDIESTTANGDIRDGQKFTFYLYNNETWHDGEAFTAVDVNHSIHMSRISSNGRSELWDIYKIEIPDDYIIELYVNKTGYMEWTETTSFYVTPEHIWRDITNVTAYSPTVAEMIGTGPYKLSTWVPGEYLSLLRHEDWRWFHLPHNLQFFSLISPKGGETYCGQITIQWTPAVDPCNHDVTYTVSYSADNGSSWVSLVSNLPTRSFLWNITNVEDGSRYRVRINASCTEGSRNICTSATFIIKNHDHLQPFIVVSPIGGEFYYGRITIQWTPAVDPCNHDVIYTVSYSADNGSSWVTLDSNFSDTSIEWDSFTVMDGDQYLLRVNASCSEGLWVVAASDVTFTINNHHLQPFTVLSPKGGETYYDLIFINWTAAEDIFNHNISYTVSYSPDNGTSWVIIASNLTTTSFTWNCITVADGNQYLVLVNASCSEGSWYVSMSDAVFTIDNRNKAFFLLQLVTQILGLGAILFFVVTVVILVHRYSASARSDPRS